MPLLNKDKVKSRLCKIALVPRFDKKPALIGKKIYFHNQKSGKGGCNQSSIHYRIFSYLSWSCKVGDLLIYLQVTAQKVKEFYKKILIILSLPIILEEYFNPQCGKEYQVNFLTKFYLIVKFFINTKKIPSGTNFLEHLIMAAKILNIPKDKKGVIVECGAYKGSSTSNLSLIAKISERKLEVFDSFQGLPQPESNDKKHTVLDVSQIHTYQKGSWAGSLNQVKRNVRQYGSIGSVNFNPGLFEKTLPNFKQSSVFVFLDVDLKSSLETCLKYLWPNLQNNSYLFCHESQHQQIASLFFDQNWWQKNLKTAPPGLVGAGNGLGLFPQPGGAGSPLGYTVKNPNIKKFKTEKQTGT